MTQLLVSVESAEEALTALQGGADLIDAKDPNAGPLGPVSLGTLESIRAAIAGQRPLTAALRNTRSRAGSAMATEDNRKVGVWYMRREVRDR